MNGWDDCHETKLYNNISSSILAFEKKASVEDTMSSIDKWRARRIIVTNLPPNVKAVSCLSQDPGGRLNKKDGLTRYGDSHVKDKTS